MSSSTAFLDVFVSIEKHVRRVAAAERWLSFYQALDLASRKSATLRQCSDDLREYADLRNAIVHERRGGLPIAEPHPSAVADLQRIWRLISSPPSVLPAFGKKVFTIGIDDPISSALSWFSVKNFSQIPVMKDGKVVGLLTGNTLARWAGDQVAVGMVDFADHSVGRVLKHTEYIDNWMLIPRSALLSEIVTFFDKAETNGKRLDAILVTNRAQLGEALLGIVTIHDIPKVLRHLAGRAGRSAAA